MKTCSRCRGQKPKTDFYKRGRNSTMAYCKECCKQWAHQQAEKGYFRERRARLLAESGGIPQKVLSLLERAARDSYYNVEKRTAREGVETDITREWVTEAFRHFAEVNYCDFTPGSPFRPSLDRVDNSRTYTMDNVRVVWIIENYARNVFTEDQLIEFCRRKLGLI